MRSPRPTQKKVAVSETFSTLSGFLATAPQLLSQRAGCCLGTEICAARNLQPWTGAKNQPMSQRRLFHSSLHKFRSLVGFIFIRTRCLDSLSFLFFFKGRFCHGTYSTGVTPISAHFFRGICYGETPPGDSSGGLKRLPNFWRHVFRKTIKRF